MSVAEVERNPPKLRAILLVLGVLLVGLLIGWLVGRSDDSQSRDDDPVAALREPEEPGDETTATVVDVSENPDVWFTDECDGRIFEGDALAFMARAHLYLAEYDEATEQLAGCVLATEERDRALELPAWSFDGRWAAWAKGDHIAVWDRATGSLADLPHAADRLVGAPHGFAFWDDDVSGLTRAWGRKSLRDTDRSELEAMDTCGAAVLPKGLWTAQPQLVADAPARRSGLGRLRGGG